MQADYLDRDAVFVLLIACSFLERVALVNFDNEDCDDGSECRAEGWHLAEIREATQQRCAEYRKA